MLYSFLISDSNYMHVLMNSFRFQMQRGDNFFGQGAYSTFLRLVFAPRTYPRYANFLREQGFEDFL